MNESVLYNSIGNIDHTLCWWKQVCIIYVQYFDTFSSLWTQRSMSMWVTHIHFLSSYINRKPTFFNLGDFWKPWLIYIFDYLKIFLQVYLSLTHVLSSCKSQESENDLNDERHQENMWRRKIWRIKCIFINVCYIYVYITYKLESPYLNIPPLFDPLYIYIFDNLISLLIKTISAIWQVYLCFLMFWVIECITTSKTRLLGKLIF